ncbi:hypothetical protein NK214_06945 [Chromobacterium sp. S0633]|uniref:hypothetical protein n=1 Tax=Chromobacterium sp. S0633 TaxID=2957805 RepID=UPI0020A1A215|nr:hypothetical protein [Chromobacterium sp. S0633]MCP1289928.1 hypothetical protein [Chromobacterium sp. S0633]
MTEQQEDYLHFLVCIDRLNNAWATLNSVKDAKDNPLIGPAFRYALVEYSTSYTRSDGPIKKYRALETKWIPCEFIELHERILKARSKVHAHSDLTVLEASLHVERVDQTIYVTVLQNMIHGLEELENLEDIIHLIEGTLDNLYKEQEVLKAALQPKPVGVQT